MTASKLIINGEEHNLGGTRRYRTLEVDDNIAPHWFLAPKFERWEELTCRITDDLGDIEVWDVLYIEYESESPVYSGAKKEESKEDTKSEKTKDGLRILPIMLSAYVSIGIYNSNGEIQQEFYMTPFVNENDHLTDILGTYLLEIVDPSTWSTNPIVELWPQNNRFVITWEVSSLKLSGRYNKFLLWSAWYVNSEIPQDPNHKK